MSKSDRLFFLLIVAVALIGAGEGFLLTRGILSPALVIVSAFVWAVIGLAVYIRFDRRNRDRQ